MKIAGPLPISTGTETRAGFRISKPSSSSSARVSSYPSITLLMKTLLFIDEGV